MTNYGVKSSWDLISLLSEDELSRLCPGMPVRVARAKLAFMDLRNNPKNKVDIEHLNLLFAEFENKVEPESQNLDINEVLNRFLNFSAVEDSTRRYYRINLGKSLPKLGLTPKQDEIQKFLDDLKCLPGGKAGYFRALRRFYNWLYSPESGYSQFRPESNPVQYIRSPKVPKKRMPAQDKKSIEKLFIAAESLRDQCLLALLIDTGGRRKEICNIRKSDIIWDQRAIQAVAKGNKEVLMPFSKVSEGLLKAWLSEYHPGNDCNIWGVKENGLVSMLRRLERKTGIKCNFHTFRRGFASELRRSGVDSLDIMKLGHWSSLPMVQRYTESVDFEDSHSRYKAPMEKLVDQDSRLNWCRGPESNWGHVDFQSINGQPDCENQHYIKILKQLASLGLEASRLLTIQFAKNFESPIKRFESVSALTSQGDPGDSLNENYK